jgi:hypothetical protein
VRVNGVKRFTCHVFHGVGKNGVTFPGKENGCASRETIIYPHTIITQDGSQLLIARQFVGRKWSYSGKTNGKTTGTNRKDGVASGKTAKRSDGGVFFLFVSFRTNQSGGGSQTRPAMVAVITSKIVGGSSLLKCHDKLMESWENRTSRGIVIALLKRL